MELAVCPVLVTLVGVSQLAQVATVWFFHVKAKASGSMRVRTIRNFFIKKFLVKKIGLKEWTKYM